MRIETQTSFIADDNTRFTNQEACEKYEENIKQFCSLIESKIGEYQRNELMLGGHAEMDSLPFKAPWLTPFGAAFINVVDIRRTDGVVEFQLGNEECAPYDEGNVWCLAGNFYPEWPD